MSELNTTKCPHCGKRINKYSRDIQCAELNTENYGDNNFVFICKKCKKKIKISFSRKVVLNYIYPAFETDTVSFGVEGI